MIRANITEIKNRLSHYIRLVQGGEQIEVLDRKTPLARIVGIADPHHDGKDASWMKRMQDLGIIKPPARRKKASVFSNKKGIVAMEGNASVLDALLEERDSGR